MNKELVFDIHERCNMICIELSSFHPNVFWFWSLKKVTRGCIKSKQLQCFKGISVVTLFITNYRER